MDQLFNIFRYRKECGTKQHRKKVVKHANSKAHLTLTNFSWKERNKQLKRSLFLTLITKEKTPRDAEEQHTTLPVKIGLILIIKLL